MLRGLRVHHDTAPMLCQSYTSMQYLQQVKSDNDDQLSRSVLFKDAYILEKAQLVSANVKFVISIAEVGAGWRFR